LDSGLAKRVGTVAFTLNVGNTHCRLTGWSSRAQIVGQWVWPTSDDPVLHLKRSCIELRKPVILSAVVPRVRERIIVILRKAAYEVHVFRRDLKPRLKIVPKPTARVGDDRIASTLGALALDSTRPWVIIDVGTAVTVNAVTPSRHGKPARFEGGLILPGTVMSLKALAQFTAQLPDLSSIKYRFRNSFIGRNTEEAMLLGVYQASVATAVALAKGQLKELGPRARIALTGGGANSPDFQKAFKKACPPGMVSVHPYLVDLGLFSCWKATSHT
jgi:pantothenate kinase type III